MTTALVLGAVSCLLDFHIQTIPMKHYWRIALCTIAMVGTARAADAAQPNILWITSEDHGPQMGCYGDRNATTPNVDALAARGMIFNRAWSTAPVCAPARTTIISGLYAPSTG